MRLKSLLTGTILFASSVAMAGGNYEGQTERPLRYRPEGSDFVIVNGTESFNRSMYGSGTPFRVDGGDKPEFSFYLPGRGGNTRLGISTNGKQKWLSDCEQIEARYRAGSMVYTISDPILDSGKIQVTAIPLYDSEGVVIEVALSGTDQPIELISAFGGVHGSKGSRNGDIGTEKQPVREFFKLKTEYCAENQIDLTGDQFKITAKAATIVGKTKPASSWKIAPAESWDNVDDLIKSEANKSDHPVAIGTTTLKTNQPSYLLIERNEIKSGGLVDRFKQTEASRKAIADRLHVETPDPYIDAAVSALTAASEGTWDDKAQIIMHGAVAWRNPYLGWRGIYWPDVMGQHDKTRLHLGNWLAKQNADPIPEKMPGADEDSNLARSEKALHSNGDMSNNHYDMQLVAIDALFRHLEWTGDLEYAKKVWPNIESHLAWERRLFRREIGPDKLPLYEAYACIWASDDLAYNGGGATHSTAYNYFHNRMAAKVAKLIGKDPSLYEKEADLILKGMKKYLWVDGGWYAEWKDILGLQQVHPNAGLYTYYHTVDSEVASPKEAFQMSRFVQTQIPHIPITGKDVPDEKLYTMPTTNWMPESWSTNNVVMAEVAHASLALWQSNQTDDAMRAFKGCLMDSMFTGLCPGNVGMCTQHDLLRGESQRDFADGCGSVSRAVFEGLFGIQPILLDGEVVIRPGYPKSWNRASIHHTDMDFGFVRDGSRETYSLISRFKSNGNWRLELPASGTKIISILADGKPATWKSMNVVGRARIEVVVPMSTQKVEITWSGNPPIDQVDLGKIAIGETLKATIPGVIVTDYDDAQSCLTNPTAQHDTITGEIKEMVGYHNLFVSARQGDLNTVVPVTFDIVQPVEITTVDHQIQITNHSSKTFTGAAALAIGENRQLIEFPKPGETMRLPMSLALQTGTNAIMLTQNGQTIGRGQIADWSAKASAKLEAIDLSTYFNDSVSQIFKNKYLSPRSPYCSLAVPTQGIGTWCKPQATAEIDDSGLRKLGEKLDLPSGVSFKNVSGDGKNIIFTSRWDNYPATTSIPLTGKSSHAYLLMAGSTSPMQSRFENGRVTVRYTDGTSDVLILENPATWWPIDRDYRIDDYAFKIGTPLPPRVNLKSGEVRILEVDSHQDKSKEKNQTIIGGAATVLDLPLDPAKELKSLELQTTANEIVIGLMGVTLVR